jgi:hypothetical protein
MCVWLRSYPFVQQASDKWQCVVAEVNGRPVAGHEGGTYGPGEAQ